MTAQIQITVDGMSRAVASDSKPTLIFEEMYPDRVKPGPNAIVVCKINGALRDLWTDLNDGGISAMSGKPLSNLLRDSGILQEMLS